MNEATPVVRLGVALPIFSSTPDAAFRAAEEAESAGLDGVFSYDHLWPLGHPGRPVLAAYPLLGALCSRTSEIGLGTLVARVGLVENSYLLGELLSVEALSRGRLVAGLGTGDSKSRPENEAYGIDYAPADERRAKLEEVAGYLVGLDIPTWVGAGATETNAVARRVGCALNFWGATPERLAAQAREGAVTWAGNLPQEAEEAATLLRAVAVAGARWIVVHWPGSTAPLLRAVERAGIARAAAGPSPR